MALKIAAVAFAYTCLAFYVFAAEPEEASQACLGCICDAATECNTTIGCSAIGTCGPFRLTKNYWTDGGRPQLNDSSNNDDYTECANEALCAGRAVQGYMKKYAKDCNGDGEINCDDYARIHFLGPEGCSTGKMDPKIETDYKYCREVFPQ